MDEIQPDSDQREIDLKISDLPGARERQVRALAFVRSLETKPGLRTRLWQAATAGLALVLLFVTVSSTFPRLGQQFMSLFAHPMPPVSTSTTREHQNGFIAHEAITQYDAKKVLVWEASTPPAISKTAKLAPAPDTCLQNTPLQAFDEPGYSLGVGAAPILVIGFSGPVGQPAVLHIATDTNQSQVGWIQHLQLLIATNYSGPITLQGGVANTDLPLWFVNTPLYNLPQAITLTSSITISATGSGTSNHTGFQSWNIFPVGIAIAQAGCYYLTATWDGGSWTAYFAAGR